MANQVLKNARLWIGGYNLSGDANSLALAFSAEQQDDTALEDLARSRLAALVNTALQCEGFWDVGAGEPDDLFGENMALTDIPVSICPIAGAAEGDRAFTFLAGIAEFQRRLPIGELLRFSAGAEGRGVPCVRGEVLHNATRTASGNGGARQLGALSATQRLYAALHVLAVSGGTPSLTVKVQSDDNSGFTSATDRITFAAKTAVGYEWASVAGAIADDYWRANFTISGSTPSFLFALVAGIQSTT